MSQPESDGMANFSPLFKPEPAHIVQACLPFSEPQHHMQGGELLYCGQLVLSLPPAPIGRRSRLVGKCGCPDELISLFFLPTLMLANHCLSLVEKSFPPCVVLLDSDESFIDSNLVSQVETFIETLNSPVDANALIRRLI